MKKFLHFFAVLICVSCVVLQTPKTAHSFQNGAPAGKTGSIGDNGTNCTQCHAVGVDLLETDAISFDFNAGNLQASPGQTYPISFSLSSIGQTVFGFQIIAEDDNGDPIGEFVLTDSDNTQLSSGYLTHTNSGTSSSTSNAVWNSSWLAPTDFEGTVTFYMAGLITNASGTNTSDKFLALNYPIEVVEPIEVIPGCTNPEATNFDPLASEDDGSCVFEPIAGVFIMGQLIDVFTCDGVLYDSGGAQDDFTLGESSVIHIYPEEEGGSVQLFFEEFDLGFFGNMTIYNGDEEGVSPILVGALGSDLLGLTLSASENNESGCLTIEFNHNPVETASGWKAIISCTNTSNLCTNPEATNFDPTATEDDGSCEFNIASSDEITSCSGSLFDSGGATGDYLDNEDNTVTIYPGNPDEFVSLFLNSFEIEGCCDDFIIYDGENTTFPILEEGSFGTSLEGQTFSASQTNETGALTVSFNTDISITNSGWEASISCINYIILGCTDTDAMNFNPNATDNDGTCDYPTCDDFDLTTTINLPSTETSSDASVNLDFIYGNPPYQIIWNTEDTTSFVDGLSVGTYSVLVIDSLNCSIDTTFEIPSWECGIPYIDVRDGQTYGTILIDTLCWMTENLNYASENTTTPIDQGNVAILGDGFVYTGSDLYNSDANGRYYSWGATESAIPFSWRLPSSQELESLLIEYTSIDHQISGTSGFNHQLSGGLSNVDGEIAFINQGATSWLWSSTDLNEDTATALTMTQFDVNPAFESKSKDFGYSIRAVFGFPPGAILGCTDSDYIEYSEEANTDDGSCTVVAIEGCTDTLALNYDSTATVTDASCIPRIEGCTDVLFVEYNQEATVEDGSCIELAVFGCTDEDSQNFNELANVDDDSCIPHVFGCTDETFVEYNELATLDDGTCSTESIFGCTDESSFNFNSAANVDDDSCIPFIDGCTDAAFVEFNGLANTDDGTCLNIIVLGCTIDYALNYNPLANTNDGSCEIEGCTDALFVEFDEYATIENNTCSIISIFGCTDDLYLEYFPPANMDDESCLTLIVNGCTDSDYIEYTASANVDDGSCENLGIIGCTDSTYLEYNPDAFVDDNTCDILVVYGCTDSTYLEFNILANLDDASCETGIVRGCTDSSFIEFNPEANLDDGSCLYIVFQGCTDSTYTEYNSNANIDNGTCLTLVIFGCTDVLAFNYDNQANTNDESCLPVVTGCMDADYVEYNIFANTEDNSLCSELVVFGCTNPEAINYNTNANTDDGSCIASLVEITYVGLPNGGIEFTPVILGLGLVYEVFWSFGDFSNSTYLAPTVFFEQNGTFEIVLTVNNGDIQVTESIFIDIVNSSFSLDEFSSSKQQISVRYFDLMGREILFSNLELDQIYVKKILYDDGSNRRLKYLNHTY